MRAAADKFCNLILVLAQIKVHALMLFVRIICRNKMKPIEGLKLFARYVRDLSIHTGFW